MLITVDPRETRVALLEEGRLVELWAERTGYRHMVGDVYVGVVQTVLPGMQAAFVDLGLERAGFLHASDMTDQTLAEEDEGPACPSIDTLMEGQRILVQIIRNPLGTKGPRLAAVVALPGRYTVLIPEGRSVGVSRRIEDEGERERLRTIGAQVAPPDMGLIVRTMASGIAPELLAADVQTLLAQWHELTRRYATASAPSLLCRAEGAALAAVRDLFGARVHRLIVDDRTLHEAILTHLEGVSPELRHRVDLYEHEVPLFERFGVERDVEHLFSRVVRLPRGGSLVIDQTEALVVIDVNTGSYVGGLDHEETVFCTNLDAADEVARQLRLRDLGGIIVVDFVDMEEQVHRDALVNRLQRALAGDRAHTRVLPVSELGIVEMTRERLRPGLAQLMREPCPVCAGTGRVAALPSAAVSLARRLDAIRAGGNTGDVRIEICPQLGKYLRGEWGAHWEHVRAELEVSELEDDTGIRRDGFRVARRLDN